MGIINTKKNTKNTITFPDPPKQLSRIEYIQQVKDSIEWDEIVISSDGRIGGTPNSTCPFCYEPKVYVKFITHSIMGPQLDSIMQHFDNCPVVKKMWNKTKIEQQEAMKQWEEQITRLTELQAKIKEEKSQ